MKQLIINADDYGRTPEINKAIIDAFKNGIVSDMSMLATCEAGFSDACKKEYMDLFKKKAGVHVSLTLGKPLTEEMRKCSYFCDKEGCFYSKMPRKKGVIMSKKMIRLVTDEFNAQIQRINNGNWEITHIDSHQHIHFRPAILKALLLSCKENDIRIVRISNTNKTRAIMRIVAKWVNWKIHSFGIKTTDYFGSYKMLNEVVDDEECKVCEILCHPMYNSEGVLIDKTSKLNADECVPLNQIIDSIPFEYEMASFNMLFK